TPQLVFAYTVDQNSSTRVVAAPLAVSQTVSDPTVAVGDSASRVIPTAQSSTSFAFRAIKAGAVNAIFTAPGYKPDTTVITVDTAQLYFGSVPGALGPNQSAQMFVAVPFTSDSSVVVSLSTSPAGVLNVPPTVTIPAGSGSVYFNVNGVAGGTAHVNATAAIARSGTSADIRVGQPKLQLSLAPSPNVRQKDTLSVQPLDSLGNSRNVTAPLTITLVSSDPTNTTFDSATITVPAGGSNVQTGVTFTQAGSYTITGSATGYTSGIVSATASGALVLISGSAVVPHSVTITAGQVVTWRNNDPIAHTTTSDAALWNSGSITTGSIYQRTFATTGTFTYHCNIHPTMTGTVVVTP